MNDLQELVNVAGMAADLIKSGKLVFVVRCKDCEKAEALSDHVICCNERNTETQSYPFDFYCADGVKKDD